MSDYVLRIILHTTAGTLNLFFALFLWIKNPKSKLNLHVGLTAFFSAVFGFGCAAEFYTHYFAPRFINIASVIPWFGVFLIPPYIAFSYYIRENLKHLKIVLSIFYALAIVIILVTITTPWIFIPIKDFHHIAYDDPQPGPLAPFGRLYLLIGMFLATYNMLKGFRKVAGFKRLQLKYIILGFSIYASFGLIVTALVPLIFDTDMYADLTTAMSVVWMGFTTFAIIRYRLMDIDTVIHRTVLWVLTSLLIVLPGYVFWTFLRKPLLNTNSLILSLVLLGWFYFFSLYNRYLQPRIDHFFRRRKYDYYRVLSEVGEKVGTELDLRSVLNRLFQELKEVLYVRNILVLMEIPGQEKPGFLEVGATGYEKLVPEQMRMEKVLLTRESGLYCWIIKNKRALEIEQVEIDMRWERMRGETLPFFQQYRLQIIVPMILEDKVIGAVGLGKKENLQPYSVKDVELLEKLGMQISVTVDNALHHKDIVEKERLEEELKLGRGIQLNLLPKRIPKIKGLRLFGLMEPTKVIGGDYYDFIPLPDRNQLGIVIGDVSGKGVAAGLLMAMVKTAIHIFVRSEVSPKQILLNINDVLNQHLEGEKFMTMLYLIWNVETSSLTYSSAGHEHILIHREKTDEVEAILSGGIMLGIMTDIQRYLEEKTIKLDPGDKILLYTDGVTEAHNQDKDRFTLVRLMDAFKRSSRKPGGELIQDLLSEVYSFIGPAPQYDDITVVVIEAE